MEALSWRTKMGLVWAGYGVVGLVSAGLIFMRYLAYVLHAKDADVYSAMRGFGDWMLEFFILGLFLVPTFFLLLVIAKSESASILYSKIVLAFSLTLPLSVASFFVPFIAQGQIGYPFMYRVLGSPMVLVAMVLSRLMVRFPRAKRLTSYVLMVELGMLVLMVGSISLPALLRRN